MTYTLGKERIGRITVEKRNNSIRLRFTVNKKSYCLAIGSYLKENWGAAKARAKEIDTDIAWQRFDTSLAKYKSQVKQAKLISAIPINEVTEITIKEIWESYLSVKGDSLSNNTKVKILGLISKWISLIPTDKLSISDISSQIEILRATYSDSTCATLFRCFLASVNLAVSQGKMTSNPYSVYKSSFKINTLSQRSRKSYDDYEVKRILEAFKEDEFTHPKSQFNDSYYYPFVLFLSLTGCRPEDAIALQWSDIIKHDKNRTVIRFSRAYSGGELRTGKTGTIRMFPVNPQLQECLDLATRSSNEYELVFPSTEKTYISIHNFTRRHFNKVVDGLYAKDEIENQLPTYHLRHSFITRMIRKGIDIATIASLVGNSPEIILRNYLGSNQGIELPEFN